MKTVILIRYGEIYLKGNNRNFFEKLLLKNIKTAVKEYNATAEKIRGRYVVSNYDEDMAETIATKVAKVFGITSVSIAWEVDTSVENIKEKCKDLDLFAYSTFKVDVRRADKSFEIHSTEFCCILGEIILNNNENIKVDVHNPEIMIKIDIRENGKTYISYKYYEAVGGLPVGCSGKGMLLLSGGIDSPVAGYEMSKRGLSLDCIHFFSYPYTSELAKEKVLTLAQKMTTYIGETNVYMVSFTEVQENIHKYCRAEYMITIMRRIMMRIAERLAIEHNCGAIITGENLGQVASQTMQSMTVTNAVVESMPVFRPLIAYDKIEIMNVSRKIDTYETSILPYEDCCTVFLPKNPVIKPTMKNVLEEESKLDIENLIQRAMDGITKVTF